MMSVLGEFELHIPYKALSRWIYLESILLTKKKQNINCNVFAVKEVD